MHVSYNISDGLAVVRFSNPPVNALSVGAGLVPALVDAIKRFLADDDAECLMIHAEGKHFSAGADVTEFASDLSKLDQVRALNQLIENASKPVVVYVHGLALGGGLELAMAAHYRIAASDARFALPEIELGIVPGGGGTQRLPRLIGLEAALDLMLSARSIGADKALEFGLIDAICDTDAAGTARGLARSGVRMTSQLAVRNDNNETAFAKSRATLATRKGLVEASTKIIELVENSDSCTFEDCLGQEKQIFEELVMSEESLALRHAFLGERAVSHIPYLSTGLFPSIIESTAVIGAGLMGTGIALTLVNAGLPVVLVDSSEEAVSRAREKIRQNLDRDIAKGRCTRDDADGRMSLLLTNTNLEMVSQADLVIEAVFEKLEAKRDIFTELDRIAHPAAILASNTSTLDIDKIANFTKRPEKVVGLHFFSPANIMRLLEIVRGQKTDNAVLGACLKFARNIGKVGVVAGNCDGFIGNRMFEEYLRQAYFLLEEGAVPEQIDSALEKWGMAMGPLRTMDLAGQDIGYSIRQRRLIEQPDRPYSKIPDRIAEKGRYGQKTGAGFYLYPDGRTAVPDPEVEAMIVDYSQEIGIVRRAIDDSEIVERCVFALINEGAFILEEGVAYRSVDIDMVWLNGYGFPKWRGGPMFHASRIGYTYIAERLRQYALGPNGWTWEPSRLITDRTMQKLYGL